VLLLPGRPNHGSSPVPPHKDLHATRAPKTPNKEAKELAGKQTRPHIQAPETV